MGSTRLDTVVPFDGHGVMRYLAGHAIPGLESGDTTMYRRRVRLDDASSVSLEVRLATTNDAAGDRSNGATGTAAPTAGSAAGGFPIGILATADGGGLPGTLVPRVRRLFDLDADSRAIDEHLAGDPALAERVAAAPGIRLPGSFDPHESLFRTMIGQQISIAAARTVVGRICRELCGDTGLFPSAEVLAERGLEVLRGPATRVATIHGVAVAIASGSLVVEATMSAEELTARLVAMPGIGPWTAGYVAMRALGAPDVLLTTDLVLLKGAAALGLPTGPRQLAQYGERWAPFRSYAGLHLWRAAMSTAAAP